MEGCREIALFLYRYWTCCFTGDPQQALAQTLDFNQTFSRPLSQKEATKATVSAQKAWTAKNDAEANERAKAMGYPGAGYRISNAKLISWLGITEEEQHHLKTIIGPKEKNRRKRVAYHADPEQKKQAVKANRRKNGMLEREVYLHNEKEKTDTKLQMIREAIAEDPQISIRKLAERTGLSKSSVQRLKARL